MRAREMSKRLDRLEADEPPIEPGWPDFSVLKEPHQARARMLMAKMMDAIGDARDLSDDEWAAFLAKRLTVAQQGQLVAYCEQCPEISIEEANRSGLHALPLCFDDYWARQRDRYTELPGLAYNGTDCAYTGMRYNGVPDHGVRYKFRLVSHTLQERLWQTFLKYGFDGDMSAFIKWGHGRTHYPIMQPWTRWKPRDQALLFRCLTKANGVKPKQGGGEKHSLSATKDGLGDLSAQALARAPTKALGMVNGAYVTPTIDKLMLAEPDEPRSTFRIARSPCG